MSGPPDFSSQHYWETRFERETSFEWLARSDVILPVVLETVKEVVKARTSTRQGGVTERDGSPLRLLHFGCGSSSLGSDIQSYLDGSSSGGPTDASSSEAADNNINVDEIISLPAIEVIDADYVPPTLLSEASRTVPLIQLDVLDPSSMASSSPVDGWDVLIDKSTADAISCGPNITDPASGASSSPLDVVLDNLAKATRRGGRWVSISYSATRYNSLGRPLPTATDQTEGVSEALAAPAWKLVSRTPLGATAIPEGRLIADGKGWRRVYEPETPIWLYILERI
jgi:hypothetical protein